MFFLQPFFIIGVVGCIGGLYYLSTLPPPPKPVVSKEDEERKKKPALSAKERTEIFQEELKSQYKRFNPNITEEELKVAISTGAKDRQEKFLGTMNPKTRKYFVESMKKMKKEMKKVERMTEDELQERVRDIEANKFRMFCIKMIILIATAYIFLLFFFETGDPVELKELVLEEWVKFTGGATAGGLKALSGTSKKMITPTIDL